MSIGATVALCSAMQRIDAPCDGVSAFKTAAKSSALRHTDKCNVSIDSSLASCAHSSLADMRSTLIALIVAALLAWFGFQCGRFVVRRRHGHRHIDTKNDLNTVASVKISVATEKSTTPKPKYGLNFQTVLDKIEAMTEQHRNRTQRARSSLNEHRASLLATRFSSIATSSSYYSVDEAMFVFKHILRAAPCRVLSFGILPDAKLWSDANRGVDGVYGDTVFVDHSQQRLNENCEPLKQETERNVRCELAQYTTQQRDWQQLLADSQHYDQRLTVTLSNETRATAFDVIFVDSPEGYADVLPGRMQSIYTASVLARRPSRTVHVFVHDCERRVERSYAQTFLAAQPTAQIGKMCHYQV